MIEGNKKIGGSREETGEGEGEGEGEESEMEREGLTL